MGPVRRGLGGCSLATSILFAKACGPAPRARRSRMDNPSLDDFYENIPKSVQRDSCVVSCVITLASLPASGVVGHCRSGTSEGQGTCGKPHEHCPFRVVRCRSLSRPCNSLREMASKRSSVRSRPGPPSFQSLTNLPTNRLVANCKNIFSLPPNFPVLHSQLLVNRVDGCAHALGNLLPVHVGRCGRVNAAKVPEHLSPFLSSEQA